MIIKMIRNDQIRRIGGIIKVKEILIKKKTTFPTTINNF